MSKFSQNLKLLRKRKNLTQKELAEKVGVKQNSYANWENGNREPNIEKIQKLADVLDVRLDTLFGRNCNR